MLKIGDFARLGQVSVRMLRNYDELGLLVPAHVDPWTNYRSYTAAQLARLTRIVALRGLGFGLEAIGRILDEELSAGQLEGMLKLRRAELAEQLRSTNDQLQAVEHRLRMIEGEKMDREFVVKPIPAVRLGEMSCTVNAQGDISTEVGPLFGRVWEAMAAAGARPGLGIGYYLEHEDGLECHCGFAYDGAAAPGFEIGELPAVAEAVTLVHLGSMEGIGASWQAIGRWLEANGAEPSGACREVYLEAPMDDEDAWVTELQQPFARR
jgi:DNA-binding transcriptional MerR regulator